MSEPTVRELVNEFLLEVYGGTAHDYRKQILDEFVQWAASREYPVKAAAEIAVDESGEVLWVERYIFKRIHGPGETFVKESRTYEVVASSITHGKHGGALVEHVCRAKER